MIGRGTGLRFLLFLGALAAAGYLAGCAFFRPSAKIDKSSPEQTRPFPAYGGPKAKVVIADFEVKAVKASQEGGSGLRETLNSALAASNRFKIQQRQALNAAIDEQGVANAAGNSTLPEPQKIKIAAGDIVISLVVTEFEPQASGGSAGTGGGGGVNSGILGGLLGAVLNKAHMAMDIRITDIATSEVIAAGRVQGQAADISGAVMTGSADSWPLGNKLFAYVNTPMEKAIRICIIEAVRYITGSIPEKYYKY